MHMYLLLKSDSVTFFIKGKQPQELPFPPDVVKHQEIHDQKAFETYLKGKLAGIPKEKTILFLTDELIYSKILTKNSDLSEEETLETFVDSVPISPTAIDTKIIDRKDKLLILATNGDLYKTILAIAQANGCNIKHVVPLKIFGSMPKDQTFSFDIFSRLEKEKELLKLGDFLQQEQQKQTKTPVSIKSILLILSCLAILATAGIWGASTLGFLPLKQATTQPTSTPTPQQIDKPTPTLTAAPSATEAAVKKADIKIQILNGSGVAGQAGKVETQLTDLGFTNVQIGNAEGPTANTTIAIFSNKVPKDYKESILEELEKTFNAIDTKEISESDDFDVSITTGEVK